MGREGGRGEVTSWHLSLSTSSTYLIPSTLPSSLPPNLLSCLFISPSLSLHLLLYFFFLFTKHSPPSFICIPHISSLSLPFPPPPILQLQSVSLSLGVNRSSIKANLNFILSATGEFIIKRGGTDCLFLFSLSFFHCLFLSRSLALSLSLRAVYSTAV